MDALSGVLLCGDQTIDDSVFNDNVGGPMGGAAVFVYTADADVSSCHFTNNSVPRGVQSGAQLNVRTGKLTVFNSTFVAVGAGGGTGATTSAAVFWSNCRAAFAHARPAPDWCIARPCCWPNNLRAPICFLNASCATALV